PSPASPMHLLTLGLIVLLIVLVIEKVFTISRSPKLFTWFFRLYNARAILTSATPIWHGSELTRHRVHAQPSLAGGSHSVHVPVCESCSRTLLGSAAAPIRGSDELSVPSA